MLRRLVIPLLSAGSLFAGISHGQDFPSKPIRIAASFAGGGSDFVARQISQGLSTALGQPVIVDNRGSGIVLYEFLTKSAPDGYSLAVSGGSFYLTPLLQKVPYDALRDFTPVAQVVREVSLVAVHPSLPVKSIKELIALAKAKPGELNYAATSIGGPPHIAAELFKSLAGVNIVRIAYKGSAQAITAVVSGEVQLVITDLGLVMPQAKSGRLKALAVTSLEPSALVPGMPTVAQAGVAGYEVVGVTGLWGPGKMPAAIVNRVNQEVLRTLAQQDVKDRFLGAGQEAVGASADQFTQFVRNDLGRTGKIIKDAGIKLE